ncbi:cytochrome c biogenesis CcdA family protein [Anaerosporobacter faecicola]|uniref:cytochrome c biogenesis CcdA family protein n=1 Tax=Anaerosporobacter faecicola TaxID=2718714 RepID=UPI00143B9B2E|nr:cytochrome c biogenesis CcdA family protein [Anaerosporobacter faecicola]
MQYVIAFLEGIITFISPCLLPMLPIYISYFANGENNRKRTLKSAIGFVMGFTLVFVLLGAFAGGFGALLQEHKKTVNVVTGLIVIVLGLNFIGIIKIRLLNQTRKADKKVQNTSFLSSVLFGIVFSIGWTPCVGAFLGSALMMASQKGTMLEGILMLIIYSAGLGIPFVISALLLDRLKGTFDTIKKHYRFINIASGILLSVVGVMMMSGTMGYLLSLLRFS